MTLSPSHPDGRLAVTVMLLARVAVGGLFVYLGLVKALHPVEFLKLVRQYQLVDSPLVLKLIAAALPWFEVFCGLLLLGGVAVQATALVSLAMLMPFSVLVWQRAVGIQKSSGLDFCAVRFDCGCGAGEVFICRKLLENGLLILLCLAMLLLRHARMTRAIRDPRT